MSVGELCLSMSYGCPRVKPGCGLCLSESYLSERFACLSVIPVGVLCLSMSYDCPRVKPVCELCLSESYACLKVMSV
jgi:hypothetical protein